MRSIFQSDQEIYETYLSIRSTYQSDQDERREGNNNNKTTMKHECIIIIRLLARCHTHNATCAQHATPPRTPHHDTNRLYTS